MYLRKDKESSLELEGKKGQCCGMPRVLYMGWQEVTYRSLLLDEKDELLLGAQ